MLIPPRRRTKRIANRLAKNGLAFARWEQGDPQLVTLRAIVETKCPQRFGRAFVYPRAWLCDMSPRVIADAILSDFARGHSRRQVASALG